MSKGLRLFGHQLHMMLVHFPIALWSVSLLGDVAWLWRGETLWAEMAFWSIAAGLALAVPTAVTGFVDYLALAGGQAERVALRHMIVMLSAAGVFTVSLVVQGVPTAATRPRMIAATLISASGVVLIGFGAWLGGELVLRHGIGRVDSRSGSHDEYPNKARV